jgi:hypothetical protein
MFCWPCIIVYHYNETNVMHFSFNLLRIKSLYMSRALLAHPQEAMHLVYCVRVMSVGCATTANEKCITLVSLYCYSLYSTVVHIILQFVGAVAKFWKAISSFGMSVSLSHRPSVRPHGKAWLTLNGFSWNFIFDFFEKLSRKFKFH